MIQITWTYKDRTLMTQNATEINIPRVGEGIKFTVLGTVLEHQIVGFEEEYTVGSVNHEFYLDHTRPVRTIEKQTVHVILV